MKKLFLALAFCAMSLAAPVAAPAAQALPPAVIAVVDLDQVFQNSAAGKAAILELKAQTDSLQARTNALRTQFSTEEQTLATSRPPAGPASTAWDAKVRDLQTRKQSAEFDLNARDSRIVASRQYVVKQLSEAATPIITAIMKERGATIVLAEGATVAHSAGIDISADVIARLDKALPRVSTTAPSAAN